MTRLQFYLIILLYLGQHRYIEAVPDFYNDNDSTYLQLEFLRDVFDHFGQVFRYDLFLSWPKNTVLRLRRSVFNASLLFLQTKDLFRTSNADHQLIRIIDMTLPESGVIIKKAINNGYFSFPNKWIILVRKAMQSSREMFKNYEFETDSDVIIAEFDNTTTEVVLEQPYKVNLFAEELNYEKYGRWSLKTKIIDERSQKVLSFRRHNLHSVILRTPFGSTTAGIADPVGEVQKLTYSPNDPASKQTFQVNSALAYYVNATLDLTVTSSFGRQLPNGSWTGVVRKLIDGEADIGGTALLLMPDRLKLIRYLSRNSNTHLMAIFRKPPLSYVSDIYHLSFQKNVWVSIILLLLVSFVIIWASFVWEVRHEDKNENFNAVMIPLEDSWSSITLFMIGAVCQQGAEMEPQRLSGRIVMIFVFLAMVFLFVPYSANIITLLQSTSNEIQSVAHLLNTPLDIGVINLEYGKTVFQKTADPVRSGLYRNKIGPNGFYSVVEGVKRVQKGLFVFIGEPGPIYFSINKFFHESEKCDLMELSDFGMSLSVFNVIPINSTYREIFKVGFNKVEEAGLLQRSFKRIYQDRPLCTKSTINFVSVGLVDCYWAFILWACIIIGAFIILLMEKLLDYYISRLNQSLDEIN